MLILEGISYPVALSSLFVIGLSNNLLPYYSSTVKGAGCQHLSKLWMGPGHSPNRATVSLQNKFLSKYSTKPKTPDYDDQHCESTPIHDNQNPTGKPSE